jgi:hypothetical protein
LKGAVRRWEAVFQQAEAEYARVQAAQERLRAANRALRILREVPQPSQPVSGMPPAQGMWSSEAETAVKTAQLMRAVQPVPTVNYSAVFGAMHKLQPAQSVLVSQASTHPSQRPKAPREPKFFRTQNAAGLSVATLTQPLPSVRVQPAQISTEAVVSTSGVAAAAQPTVNRVEAVSTQPVTTTAPANQAQQIGSETDAWNPESLYPPAPGNPAHSRAHSVDRAEFVIQRPHG